MKAAWIVALALVAVGIAVWVARGRSQPPLSPAPAAPVAPQWTDAKPPKPAAASKPPPADPKPQFPGPLSAFPPSREPPVYGMPLEFKIKPPDVPPEIAQPSPPPKAGTPRPPAKKSWW